MTESESFLQHLIHHKKDIHKEILEYFSSDEICRVYDYDNNGKQINTELHKEKIIKHNCNEILNWYNSNQLTDVSTKCVMLFVDALNSLVPYHTMYYNQNGSLIKNENCIFNDKFFKTTLGFRSKATYAMGVTLIKPNTTIITPAKQCKPYLNVFAVVLEGSDVFVKTDYLPETPLTGNAFYFHSNPVLMNKGKNPAIIFDVINWMFNKIDVSDNRQLYY